MNIHNVPIIDVIHTIKNKKEGKHWLIIWMLELLLRVASIQAQHRLWQCNELFCIFFGGLECVGLSFAYVAHFCIFERCLDWNTESCRRKQARHQLIHSSPFKPKNFKVQYMQHIFKIFIRLSRVLKKNKAAITAFLDMAYIFSYVLYIRGFLKMILRRSKSAQFCSDIFSLKCLKVVSAPSCHVWSQRSNPGNSQKSVNGRHTLRSSRHTLAHKKWKKYMLKCLLFRLKLSDYTYCILTYFCTPGMQV